MCKSSHVDWFPKIHRFIIELVMVALLLIGAVHVVADHLRSIWPPEPEPVPVVVPSPASESLVKPKQEPPRKRYRKKVPRPKTRLAPKPPLLQDGLGHPNSNSPCGQ